MAYEPAAPPITKETALARYTLDELARIAAELNGMVTDSQFINGIKSVTGRVNKFGRSTDVQLTVTDIWDRANATDTQYAWVAPTAARQHGIVSSSTSDIHPNNGVGAGAHTVRVYGLPSWTESEVSEDIELNGTTSVNTVNSYVIIHRMQVIDCGTSGPNVGKITALALVDITNTAQINAGEGQTQMAIYGVPEGTTAYMKDYYASVLRNNLSTNERHVDIQVVINQTPDSEPSNYTVKSTIGTGTRAADPFELTFSPWLQFAGPCIIKVQATGSSANLDVSAGFDLLLE